MAYDGIRTGLGILTTLLGATFEGHRADVATLHGITLDTLKATIRAKQREYQYPHAEISPVAGPVDVNGGSVYAELSRWVILVDRDADPAVLALRKDAWLTVLMRTFGDSGAPDGSWSCVVVEVDESPPYQVDDTWVSAVGVRVAVKMGSDL